MAITKDTTISLSALGLLIPLGLFGSDIKDDLSVLSTNFETHVKMHPLIVAENVSDENKATSERVSELEDTVGDLVGKMDSTAQEVQEIKTRQDQGIEEILEAIREDRE